jgi:hypothetical protein
VPFYRQRDWSIDKLSNDLANWHNANFKGFSHPDIRWKVDNQLPFPVENHGFAHGHDETTTGDG